MQQTPPVVPSALVVASNVNSLRKPTAECHPSNRYRTSKSSFRRPRSKSASSGALCKMERGQVTQYLLRQMCPLCSCPRTPPRNDDLPHPLSRDSTKLGGISEHMAKGSSKPRRLIGSSDHNPPTLIQTMLFRRSMWRTVWLNITVAPSICTRRIFTCPHSCKSTRSSIEPGASSNHDTYGSLCSTQCWLVAL